MRILGTGTRDVEILAPLKIKCLQTTIENGVLIGGSQPVESNGLFVSNNAIINRNLTVNGNLTVDGFYSHKPYTAFYTNGSGVVSATIRPGYITPTVNRTGAGTYVYTLPTAHPSGIFYEVFVQQRKALATSTLAHYGVSIISNTQFTVWSTNYLNSLIDSDFYLHTVP
jgi:hypothetical protein